MDLEELLNSNANLEEYLGVYGENPAFLFRYYLQDINRILTNYYSYCSHMNFNDKIRLFYEALKNLNYRICDMLLNDIASFYGVNEEYNNLCDKLYDDIISLDKAGKIDIKMLTSKVLVYRRNPLYFIKKDIVAFRYMSLNKKDLFMVLDYLNSQGYMFREEDSTFLDYNVLNDPDSLLYFINNCNYVASLNLASYIGNMPKEELFNFYNKGINGKKVDSILDVIYNKLNYDNYDYNTIIKDYNLYINYEPEKKEQIINLLNEIKAKGFNANIILKMDRVDMNIVNEFYSIVGDKLKISPIVNQLVNDSDYSKGISEIPYYDVDYIKKSEEKLDLYASSVNDTLDKDGDIKSLSPLEKYIAAYILTTKFAMYRYEDKGDKSYASRSVYEFINSTTNTKIVCAGYVHLLREILYRMGIKDTIDWAVSAESKDPNSTFLDHGRMLIHLVDPKYGIDGVYMSDPTWDNTDVKSSNTAKHMLMSHDELLEIDPNLTLKKLRADDSYMMNKGLGINNSNELFFKQIPRDTIIKAYLAVDHFLDKNMKMVNNGEYDLLEYVEMAEKLKYYEVYQENKDKVYDKLQKMSLDEIEYNYPGLLDEFLHDLNNNMKTMIAGIGINTKIVARHEENRVLFGYEYLYATEEFPERDITIEDVSELRKIIPINSVSKMFGSAKFFIEMDSNRPIYEQYEELLVKMRELDMTCQKIVGKNGQKGVK